MVRLSNLKSNDRVERFKDFDSKRHVFNEREKTYLPLRENEKLINRFAASESVLPCCVACPGCYCCIGRHSKPCANCCSWRDHTSQQITLW